MVNQNSGWVYTVSDNIGDVFKFGFTIEPLNRLSSYNSTECLRPVRFLSLVEYSNERQARDVEVLVRKSLFEWIKNPKIKPEVSSFTSKSLDSYSRVIDSSNFITKDKASLYNSIFEKFTSKNINYEKTLRDIVDKARVLKISEIDILKNILQENVGYFYDDAPERVVTEKRRKFLISLDGRDIYYDTKPKLIERFKRLSTLDYLLKTNCLIS